MAANTTTPTTIRMTTPRIAGWCGYCGTAKWLPAFPVNEIAPRPVVVCGHTSD